MMCQGRKKTQVNNLNACGEAGDKIRQRQKGSEHTEVSQCVCSLSKSMANNEGSRKKSMGIEKIRSSPCSSSSQAQ